MRGEYAAGIMTTAISTGSPPHAWGIPIFAAKSGNNLGSPPHAWGILAAVVIGQFSARFTPTCVGNTLRC